VELSDPAQLNGQLLATHLASYHRRARTCTMTRTKILGYTEEKKKKENTRLAPVSRGG
jgi:hypothetical protein